MNRKEFMFELTFYMLKWPQQRRGQAIVNLATELGLMSGLINYDPEYLGNNPAGYPDEVCPWNDDSKIPAFLDFIGVS